MSQLSTNGDVQKSQGRVLYCHFSFKRPKGAGYGLFAAAVYSDFEGKKLLAQKTRKLPLWEDHQFVTAIQSYEHALYCISEWQGMMVSAQVRMVMLVTDNSTLAGWIENPSKNKAYTKYMQRAVSSYRSGAFREIMVGVGLCEPRKAEKSYKFCKENRVVNKFSGIGKEKAEQSNARPTTNQLKIGEYTSIMSELDTMERDSIDSVNEIGADAVDKLFKD